VAAKNHYATLQVSPKAGQSVVRAAYMALLKEHDLNLLKNKNLVQELNEAYHTLSRRDLREEYDRTLFYKGPGEVIGSYRKLEQIAEGAFGRTFKGEHIKLGGPVCIKDCFNVSPEYYPMLEEEANAMWDLSHYEIPAIRDFATSSDGTPVLIMSYAPGLTLEEWVKEVGPFDPADLSWIVERSLNALMYIHFKNVIHGDIKPQNIIIHEDRHIITLVDFGLSLIKPHAGTSSKGYTPLFAPPEEEAGETLLPQSDFYSLGMTMIYALVGGDLDYLKAKQIPSDVPEPMVKFIRKLIVRDILSRPSWNDNPNLFQEFQRVRFDSFGQAHSGMKLIKRR